jgi:hypothetical protein
MKRKICILKGQDNNLGAIELLIEYLNVFMGDIESWSELADLYLKEQMYCQSI